MHVKILGENAKPAQYAMESHAKTPSQGQEQKALATQPSEITMHGRKFA